MADTNFVPGTVVTSEWFNDTNDITYGLASTASGKGADMVAFDFAALPASINRINWAIQTLGGGESLFRWIPISEWTAIKNGSSAYDCTASIQSALDSGAKNLKGISGAIYHISGIVRMTASGQTLDGCGAKIVQDTVNTSAVVIGYNGAGFVKVDDVRITGFEFIGADNGLTTTTSAAVTVYGTSAIPYTETNGCKNITVDDCKASGWCIGLAATGVKGLRAIGNEMGGMKYHAAAGAGGYGVLAQTCFDVTVKGNTFNGAAGDRHAVYISADASRTYDADNVCKTVRVTSNTINWSGVSDITGFESCVVARGAFDLIVSGNIMKGGYGGIDYEIQNGPGEDIVIADNIIIGVRNKGTTARGAVNFVRSSGTYRTANVTISGNVIGLVGSHAIGIQAVYVDGVTVTGNNVSSPNGANSIGAYFAETTRAVLDGNTIYMGNGNSAVMFTDANDNVTIDRNTISGSNYFKYRFFTVPTNLKFGYSRACYVSSNGAGAISVVNGEDDILVSAVSETNGVTLTFEPWVDLSLLNVSLLGTNSSVGHIYHRSSSGTTLVIGVTNHTGVPMPAASNAYLIAVTINK